METSRAVTPAAHRAPRGSIPRRSTSRRRGLAQSGARPVLPEKRERGREKRSETTQGARRRGPGTPNPAEEGSTPSHLARFVVAVAQRARVPRGERGGSGSSPDGHTNNTMRRSSKAEQPALNRHGVGSGPTASTSFEA